MPNSHTDQTELGEWVALDEAATRLGIGVNAVRSRIKRRSIRSKMGNDKRLRVWLEPDLNQIRTKSGPGPNQHKPNHVQTYSQTDIDDLKAAHTAELARLTAAMGLIQAAHAGEVAALRASLERALNELDEQAAWTKKQATPPPGLLARLAAAIKG